MKIKIEILAVLMSVMSFSGLIAQNYKLVWEDNFNGSTLDSTKWNLEQRVGVWNTGANKELQHYKKENVTVGDDGNGNNCLILTAKKENHNGYVFTSGKVTSKGKFAFKRGKLEASIKMPDLANGLWPAFWSLGYTPAGWPDCGEIDVLEMGHKKGISDGVQNRFIGSHLFWGPYPSDYGKEFVTTEDLSLGYYKHTMIWDETSISVYFNDAVTPYFTMGIEDASLEEFRNFQEYIILNMAVGGSLPGITNAADITAPLPASMFVDWIKVYQIEGKEDFAENLEIFGDFGVFEDETSADMRMDLGYDLSVKTIGVTPNTDEVPFEGNNVLSYTADGADFELKLTAGLPRNMSNYNKGSIQYYIKTNITGDIQIGIADSTGNEKFVSFNAENANNFLRDGNWQSTFIFLADYADVVDLSALKQMLILKGNATDDGYFSIDKVVYKETVPAKGYYAIFADNPNITDGFVIDNVTNNMFIWNNTVAFNTFYTPYEGENVLSFKSTGAEAWFGFGYHSANPLNFEAYANGYLNISIKTTSTNEFYIGMDGSSSNAEIHFTSGSDGYGFERDGEWHHLNIPFTDLTQQGLDLSSINHVFKTGGGSIENIAFDCIFYSEGFPTLENPAVIPVSVVKKEESTIHSYFNNNFNKLVVNNINTDCYITIYGISGQLIYAANSNTRDVAIDMQNYTSGVYVIKVIAGENVYVNKVIKK